MTASSDGRSADGSMSGADVRGVKFSPKWKGYDLDEVDAFVEEVAARIDALHVKIAQLTATSGAALAPSTDGAPPMGRLDAGWRSEYITEATAEERRDVAAGVGVADEVRCVFCRILGAHTNGTASDEESLIVHRGATCVAILNKYPYSSGHLMVIPIRHVGDLASLTPEEHAELWSYVQRGTAVLQRAYQTDGINVGANLGRAAGAGIPGHLHIHLVPRWNGDTNFMTAIAETRVTPESLDRTWLRLRAAW